MLNIVFLYVYVLFFLVVPLLTPQILSHMIDCTMKDQSEVNGNKVESVVKSIQIISCLSNLVLAKLLVSMGIRNPSTKDQ